MASSTSLAEVVAAVSAAEAELIRLKQSSTLPDEPDRTWVDAWLHRSYLRYWDQLKAND